MRKLWANSCGVVAPNEESVNNYLTVPEKSATADLPMEQHYQLMNPESGGRTMTVARRISLLLLLVSLLGCATQIQPAQTSQPGVETGQQEQQKKPMFPTFTYRLDTNLFSCVVGFTGVFRFSES